MEKLEQVSWELEYETGVIVIDKQHFQLFQTYNEFATLCNDGLSVKTTELIDSLILYTKQHFTYEERIMRTFEYEKIEEHIAEHKEFIQKITDLKIMEERGAVGNHYAELGRYLNKWLIEHIMEFDKEYCKKIPSDA